MAYDRQFLSLDWLFRDVSSDEQAVTGLNFSVVPTWSGAEAALAELNVATGTGQSLINAMALMLGAPAFRWASYSRLYAIKVAAIGTDGLYLTDPKIFEDTTPPAGTTANTLPQATVAVSTRSGSGIGTANNGRMFLPHTALPIATNFSSAAPAETASALGTFRTFINDVTLLLTTDITDPVQPFIMSNQSPSPSKPVLQIRVGNVTDTQRRRRRQIPEVYATQVLP